MPLHPLLLAPGPGALVGAASVQVSDPRRSEAPASTAAQQLNVPPPQHAGLGPLAEAERSFVEESSPEYRQRDRVFG
jgi:hypothetical protein